ncbi:MAG: hypothetical protein MK066_10135 [Crocinitomicaceae bacterium]|nr:hypothetical protein [Crocinitomicaceae bacterium]
MNKVYGLLFSGMFLSIVIFLSAGCAKDKTQLPIPELCPDTISFSIQIEPIIINSCSITGCHDAAASGGYNLLGHSAISGNASEILSTIRHDPGVVPMPYFQDKLNDSLIQQFDCWIAQGKLNN